MGSNTGDVAYFDGDLRRFEARRQREPEGWMHDELRRNIEAINAFKNAFVRRRGRQYRFTAGPINLTMPVEGVRINARLDVSVTETDAEDITYSGGCVLFIAKGDGSRRNIIERMKTAAAVIQWELESSNPNIEPLPRLCMSFDVFGEAITKAATSTTRLREHITESCREVTDRWDGVTPPADYDGPNWR